MVDEEEFIEENLLMILQIACNLTASGGVSDDILLQLFHIIIPLLSTPGTLEVCFLVISLSSYLV